MSAAPRRVGASPKNGSPAGRRPVDPLLAALIGLGVFAVYVAGLAPTVLRSDSGEFHVMPWVLGIAHAPGYPLLTLLGRLAMLLPVGDPAYRINLLDAAAAAAAVGLVYLTVVELAGKFCAQRSSTASASRPVFAARVGGLAAAAALGLGATYWQQSLVGGPRPLVFFFTALLLWLTVCWDRRRRAVDLLLLAAAAGLALTHHLNLLMLLPGLLLFVLARLPSLARQPRLFGPALLALIAPLLLYLYLPLRSAMDPPLGANDLANPRELLLYLTAANYQDTVLSNCAGSRLVQVQRYLVFLTLQFGPLLPFGSLAGALVLLATAPLAGLLLLYAFLSNALFGMCSSLAMPDYIVPSYVVAAIWFGLALAWPLDRLASRAPRSLGLSANTLMATLIAGFGAYRLLTGLPYQSMAERTADAERGRTAMAQAQSNGLVLSDWESVTPLWYSQFVLGLNRTAKSALITAAPASDKWLVEAQKGLEDRPVSLAQRVPALDSKYRLLPVGSLFEVSERSTYERSTTAGVQLQDHTPRLLSYRLDPPLAAPGDLVRLTLYERASAGRDPPMLRAARFGGEQPAEFTFAASQRSSPRGQSEGEVSGEVYELTVPVGSRPGPLPLELLYRQADRAEMIAATPGGSPWSRIASLQVVEPFRASPAESAPNLANFGNQLTLQSGRLSAPVSRDLGGDSAGARASLGRPLELELRWSGRRWMDDSYTLFVHLLDGQSRLVAQTDSLPLGGVYHTYKWVPGQTVVDWYRLTLPQGLPPGDYWLEVGAYQSVTTRRLPLLGPNGGSDRTSFRWGPIRLE